MSIYHTLKSLCLAIVAVAVAASCGSSRKVVEPVPGVLPPDQSEISAPSHTQTGSVSQQPVIEKPLVQRMVADLDLAVGMGKDKYNLGGKVSMKRGQVVRLNLQFMGFIEVGIIEFTPDNILIVNRMGKEYTRAPYDSMDELRKNNINFATIEQLAWANLYSENGNAIREKGLDKMLERLINSNMKNGKQVTVDISVGRPDTSRDFETYTTVRSSYKEVPVQLLMARLMSFAK